MDFGLDISGDDDGRTLVFDPARHGWEALPDDGFIGFVGPLWKKPCGSGSRFGFLSDDRHRNRRGIVQGGMLMTFADRSLGMAIDHVARDRPKATTQLDIHFIASARLGEFVETTPTVLRMTRSLAFAHAQLCVGEKLVATASGVWKFLNRDELHLTRQATITFQTDDTGASEISPCVT